MAWLTNSKVATNGRTKETKRKTKYVIRKPASTRHGPVSAHEFSITRAALHDLIDYAASDDPEIGGLGFGPFERLGVDTVELDVAGSKRATSTVYTNDGAWGIKRQNAHMDATPCRTLQMMWHTHPRNANDPSSKVGRARGDVGMFEEFFNGNEVAQVLLCPILTINEKGVVQLNPWVAERIEGGVKVGLANIKMGAARKMPEAVFNPAWLASQKESDERSAYVKRLKGVVSDSFRNATILMVGVGGGSYMAEKLARYMPKKIILVDPDVVEMSNLARTTFTYQDATSKRPKVEALRERILAINPFVEVDVVFSTLEHMSKRALRDLIKSVDLIVEGTDSFGSKKLTNEVARIYQRPAVFIGIHAKAESGRVIFYVPGKSPCYQCTAPERYEVAETGRLLNLDGQAGSVVDIQLVDMIALKVVLAILDRNEDTSMGRFYRSLAKKGNEISIRTTPECEYGKTLFSALLSDLPTDPKPYAKELTDAFLGIDSVVMPSRYRAGCECLKPGKRLPTEILAHNPLWSAP